jgi:hypothetical protein
VIAEESEILLRDIHFLSLLFIETTRPNTNRHAQKCLHCAGIESATSCVIGEYSDGYTALYWLHLILVFLVRQYILLLHLCVMQNPIKLLNCARQIEIQRLNENCKMM